MFQRLRWWFFYYIMNKLKPLENTLESSPTLLRVYRSMYSEMIFTHSEWSKLGSNIAKVYDQLDGPPLKKVIEKSFFVDYWHGKVRCYPPEFIPVMINIIKEHLNKAGG